MPFTAGAFTSLYNWLNEANAGNSIDPTKFTAEEADIATGLSTCILKDGTQTVTADIPWNGKKITGLGAPTAAGDAANKGYVDSGTAGSFTATLTGMTGTVSGPVSYVKGNGMVLLYLPPTAALTGTSNSSAMTMTGMAATLFPASTRSAPCGNMRSDASAGASVQVSGMASVSAAGVITFSIGTTSGGKLISSAASWDSSSTKGLDVGWSLIYAL